MPPTPAADVDRQLYVWLAPPRLTLPLSQLANALSSTSNHFDADGNAHMVDVSAKAVTVRKATARGTISMRRATAEQIRGGQTKKGDVLGVARLAAIQASKWTAQLIPLCHAIPIEGVQVDFHWVAEEAGDTAAPSAGDHGRACDDSRATLRCEVTVRTSAKTGVEMEAMTALSVACLTVYDMVKGIDRGLTIGPIELMAKSGGKSGDFLRPQS